MDRLSHWIDLDGPLLIKNNPFKGVVFSEGKLHINNLIGTGALLNESINFKYDLTENKFFKPKDDDNLREYVELYIEKHGNKCSLNHPLYPISFFQI